MQEMLVNNVPHAHKHMHVRTPTHSHLSQNSTSHHKCEFLATTANEHLTPVPSHNHTSASVRLIELLSWVIISTPRVTSRETLQVVMSLSEIGVATPSLHTCSREMWTRKQHALPRGWRRVTFLW